MTLTELPAREKVTIAQKRAAQRSAGNKAVGPSSTQANGESTQAAIALSNTSSASSKQYILTSTLPARYRIASILSPAQIPSASAEAAYIGLTTFVLSLIYLSPGHTLPESRLERHLKTMNAGDYVLGEKTEKGALARMQREGYIVKVRERGEGEDTVDFHVGPRGKAEVGEKGVAGLVRGVYDTGGDEVERRLVRSLGEVVIEKRSTRAIDGDGQVGEGEEDAEGGEGRANGVVAESERRQTRRSSGRSRQTRRQEDEEGEEEEEEEEAEEEEEGEEEDEEEEEDDEEEEDE